MGKMSKTQELTDKQLAFCREYVVDRNATQAAIRAGYSERTARQQGAENLTKPVIRAEIARREAVLEERAGVRAEAVIRELALLAFANMGHYMQVTSEGDPYIDLSGLTPDQAAALHEVTIDEYTEGRGKDKRQVRRVRIKLADKERALVELGKHLGIFERHNERQRDNVVVEVLVQG